MLFIYGQIMTPEWPGHQFDASGLDLACTTYTVSVPGTSTGYFRLVLPSTSAEYFIEYFRQVLLAGTCARYFRRVRPLSTSSKYFHPVLPLNTSIGYFHWYFCRVLLVFVLIVQLVARKHQTASL